MTFNSTPEIEAIIDLIFDPSETPLFIDGAAPLEDIVRDPEAFMCNASERFGLEVTVADLKLTIPEFADRVRNRQQKK